MNANLTARLTHQYDTYLTTTETSTFKYKYGWDANVISASFGGALQFTRDWGELVFETNEALAVRHDLESPWYGLVFWSVVWDENSRNYSWMRPGWREQPHETTAQLQAVREQYFEPALSNRTDPFKMPAAQVYEDRWLHSPSATALGWLARCAVNDSRVVQISPNSDLGWRDRRSEYRKSGAAAFGCLLPGQALLVTLVNTDPAPHVVKMSWGGGGEIPPQTVVRSSMLGRGLPIEPQLGTRQPEVVQENITLDGAPAGSPFASWTMPAYSIQHFQAVVAVSPAGEMRL